MFLRSLGLTDFLRGCALLFLAALPLCADEIGIREVNIPLEGREIHSRAFLQALLEMGGSDVVLPENLPGQNIRVEGPGARLSLFTWNVLLRDFGVKLSVEQQHLNLRVDLKTFEGTLDGFEKTLMDLFNVEREAKLTRLSAPDCTGPVVVMTHGLDSGQRLFRGTCDFLVAQGYDLYFFEYPNDDRVQRNAERFSEALKTLPPERRQDISLVTVSMGGVISQLMLETPELAVKGVSRLIACVPPFQGSEMAALRGAVEVGDHAMNLIFDPGKALDFWGDGMGRAGIDLQPRSLLMEKLDTLKRNPGVKYSILAGNKGVLDPELLKKAREEIAREPAANSVLEATRRLTLDRIDLLLKFQTPHGDGAVQLDSATLEGVDDREVLPYSHLEFLTGFKAREDIPALQEVLKRLPPVASEPAPAAR